MINPDELLVAAIRHKNERFKMLKNTSLVPLFTRGANAVENKNANSSSFVVPVVSLKDPCQTPVGL